MPSDCYHIAKTCTHCTTPPREKRCLQGHRRQQLSRFLPLSQSTAIMATELTVQSERAFQKQPHIFLNSKAKATKSRGAGKAGRRWFKDVGLGFRTPRTAIEGSYIGMHI